MIAAKCMLVLCLVVLLFAIQPTYGRGGRGGGGSRGGGSRGSSSGSRGRPSSSSGTRGSSSSSSGSQASSSGSSGSQASSSGSSGTHGSSTGSQGSSSGKSQWDTSRNNNPSPPGPPQPSAPELPKANPKPSAPRLPESPGHSQPSNPNPYNPNFPEPGRPGPGPGPSVSQGNQPSYGNAAPGNAPPYGANQGYPPLGNPPPYGAQGNPPPYGPQGNPPPYAPRQNPPPYSPQGNPPPYGVNPQAPPPYGPNIPQAPPPYPPSYGGNRPNIPQGNPPTYGVNPGSGSQGYHPPPYGTHSGNVPHGGQPPYSPYPRQPGMVYPPGGVGAGSSNYFVPGGFQGGSGIKPYKKKGLLGGLFSLGKAKKPKHHGMGSFGTPSFGGQRISPMHMLLPAAAMHKPYKKFSSHSNLHHWILPYVAYRSMGGFGMGIDYDGYGRCFTPRAPVNGSITCERTFQGILCQALCSQGYTFADNSTTLEARCWRNSGHWSRSRFFPPCIASCTEQCHNGGTCKSPGVCKCKPEYRGHHCEHHIMNCDVRKLARGSKISWVCSHSRNETLCTIKCREPLKFESPPAEKYHCHVNGTWTPDSIPVCIEDNQSAGGIQNPLITTTPKEEDSTKDLLKAN